MNVWKGIVGERLIDGLLDEFCRLAHLAGSQIGDDCSGLLLSRFAALLRMNGFEHVGYVADLGCGHVAEDVAIKMHDAPLPTCLG